MGQLVANVTGNLHTALIHNVKISNVDKLSINLIYRIPDGIFHGSQCGLKTKSPLSSARETFFQRVHHARDLSGDSQNLLKSLVYIKRSTVTSAGRRWLVYVASPASTRSME